jgi:two-component system, cell cycle response regulator DivK
MPPLAHDDADGNRAPLALLVDRDANTRRLYADFLRLSACTIEEAEDGREALAKAIARRPAIVVTETRLPGINGYNLCNLLRSDPATRDVPILFLTSKGYERDLRRAEQIGGDGVLVKPCLPETLLREMQRLLREAANLRERPHAIHETVHAQAERSDQLLAISREHTRRLTLSRAHVRVATAAPPVPPPSVMCPSCDKPLHYVRSHVGGVNARSSEQWDYFECPAGCGEFQYRQRTRKLRRVC